MNASQYNLKIILKKTIAKWTFFHAVEMKFVNMSEIMIAKVWRCKRNAHEQTDPKSFIFTHNVLKTKWNNFDAVRINSIQRFSFWKHEETEQFQFNRINELKQPWGQFQMNQYLNQTLSESNAVLD